MADLISREALIAEINRIGGHWLSEWDTAGVLSLASRISAVDAVEVVRCKDCKRCDGFPEPDNIQPLEVGICKFNMRAVEPNDFCSYGKRREENG